MNENRILILNKKAEKFFKNMRKTPPTMKEREELKEKMKKWEKQTTPKPKSE